jgi:hypothetical protein
MMRGPGICRSGKGRLRGRTLGRTLPGVLVHSFLLRAGYSPFERFGRFERLERFERFENYRLH